MFLNDVKNTGSGRALCIVLLTCIFCLLPFVNKAFHIDDPLFVWTAKQIVSHPLDFYGFTVNWYGWEMPIADVAQNPPLASYYMAFIAYWFGWSEPVLHLAFLLPACVVAVGTFCLAQDLCEKPLLATLASIATPVFLVSGTTVMCDVLMLSFWIVAVILWRRGLKTNGIASFFVAALCIAACGLTKYYGISLIPLLLAYSLVEKRGVGLWLVFLLIPVLLLGGYQVLTQTLYGKDHIMAAASYAVSTNNEYKMPVITKTVTGLAFIGGCLATLSMYAPILWRKSRLVIVSLLVLLVLVLLLKYDYLDGYPIAAENGINWLFVFQLPLFVCSGGCFIFLVLDELWHKRDADTVLVALWATGTIVFTLFVNWTVNGRSLLPLVPVVGILIVWKLSRTSMLHASRTQMRLYLPLIPAFIVALFVTWADYRLANASRDAAHSINSDFVAMSGNLWFEGHWGFQYYMQLAGSKALDFEKPQLRTGDIVIVPSHNSGLKVLHKHMAIKIREYKIGIPPLLTMDKNAGAGFYADLDGALPLPFCFGPATTSDYNVFRMISDKSTRFTY